MNEISNKNKLLSKEEIKNQIKEFIKNLDDINENIINETNKEDKSEDKINSLKKLKSELINAIDYFEKQLNETKKFIIPNNLKLNPTDTKEIKFLKRKKVKKLKYQFKEKEIDKNSEIIKNNWENFNKNLKNKKNNKTLNGYNPIKLINNKK